MDDEKTIEQQLIDLQIDEIRIRNGQFILSGPYSGSFYGKNFKEAIADAHRQLEIGRQNRH